MVLLDRYCFSYTRLTFLTYSIIIKCNDVDLCMNLKDKQQTCCRDRLYVARHAVIDGHVFCVLLINVIDTRSSNC